MLQFLSTLAAAEEPPAVAPPVREIIRGLYAQADVGTETLVGLHGVTRPCGAGSCALLSGQMSLGLALGDDFLDREHLSAGWEVRLGQALFNGPSVDDLTRMDALGEISPVEGDLMLLSGTGTLEVSGYPTRRVGLGVRGGGGLGYAPILMTDAAFHTEVLNRFDVTGVGAHDRTLPILLAGVTVEYYTKLAHFSVGASADARYLLGFDLGITPSGWLKYTFQQ